MKDRFVKYNGNKYGNRVGDCTIRAISYALDQDWDTTFDGIVKMARRLGDMPSGNAVWGAYLKQQGFTRHIIPNYLPEDYTVNDFCIDNPEGVYILALDGHVVCVIDGFYYDSFNSGDLYPIFYWSKNERR